MGYCTAVTMREVGCSDGAKHAWPHTVHSLLSIDIYILSISRLEFTCLKILILYPRFPLLNQSATIGWIRVSSVHPPTHGEGLGFAPPFDICIVQQHHVFRCDPLFLLVSFVEKDFKSLLRCHPRLHRAFSERCIRWADSLLAYRTNYVGFENGLDIKTRIGRVVVMHGIE